MGSMLKVKGITRATAMGPPSPGRIPMMRPINIPETMARMFTGWRTVMKADRKKIEHLWNLFCLIEPK